MNEVLLFCEYKVAQQRRGLSLLEAELSAAARSAIRSSAASIPADKRAKWSPMRQASIRNLYSAGAFKRKRIKTADKIRLMN